MSLDREDPQFFDNSRAARDPAHRLAVPARSGREWSRPACSICPTSIRARSGALVAVYRYLGEHFKVGAGYNFTDFSDDLTDLSYDHQGVFINLIGTM